MSVEGLIVLIVGYLYLMNLMIVGFMFISSESGELDYISKVKIFILPFYIMYKVNKQSEE